MQSISNISESEKEENNRQIDASRKQVKDMLERFRERGLKLCKEDEQKITPHKIQQTKQ
jgi:hypothetical protein